MRKIIMFNQVSVDGYFTGVNGEIDWFIHNPDITRATHQLMNPDTVIFGQKTYEMFSGFWPHVAKDLHAPKDMKTTADELNHMTKLVVSDSLNKVSWANSRLIKGDLVSEIKTIKAEEGKDITIFGSGSIVRQLTDARLIDEYIIQVTPVILGTGLSLFKDAQMLNLKLMQTITVEPGCVILHYKI